MGTFCGVYCVISWRKTLDRWHSSLRRVSFRQLLLEILKTDLLPKSAIYAQFKIVPLDVCEDFFVSLIFVHCVRRQEM